MNTTIKTALGALAVALSISAAAADDHDRIRELRRAGEILPLERILENARAEHPGRVIEAELKRRDDGYAYEIEVIDHAGIVWELLYDADTGELIRSEQE